jgi:hypothetical protein
MKMAEMFLKFEGPTIEGESLDEAQPRRVESVAEELAG